MDANVSYLLEINNHGDSFFCLLAYKNAPPVPLWNQLFCVAPLKKSTNF